MGRAEELGTVEAGKDADLLLLGADPTASVEAFGSYNEREMSGGAPIHELGRMLLLVGLVLAAGGLLLLLADKLPGLGRLPGDIVIRREGWTFYFPVATMIVVSLLLSLLLTFWFRR